MSLALVTMNSGRAGTGRVEMSVWSHLLFGICHEVTEKPVYLVNRQRPGQQLLLGLRKIVSRGYDLEKEAEAPVGCSCGKVGNS